MIMDVNKILKNNKGQALVEFLLFLPFMIMMYSVILSISGALNGSINQQKITRGYFYHRMQNNSTIPKPRREGVEPSDAWRTYGTQIMGWMEKFGTGDRPLMTCYKLNLPLGEKEGDECEKSYSDPSTQFIRVGTVYGICGATYSNVNGARFQLPMANSGLGQILVPSSSTSCQILQ